MATWCESALERLEQELKGNGFDKYGNAMKSRVCETLKDFCRQDAEFAQAVVQGGTFSDCMKAVSKNCGTSLSDLEAFSRAVKFYFPGAAVRFEMHLDLCAETPEEPEEPKEGRAVVLNLEDFW